MVDLSNTPGHTASRALVGGIPVDIDSLAGLTDRMLAEAPQRRLSGAPPALVFDCNGQALSLSAKDPAYRSALLRADIVHADGQSIVTASQFLPGPPIPDRSATTDLFIDGVPRAVARGLRYYLLGGTEDVNAACAAAVERQAPGLIVGRHHGYWSPDQEAAIVDGINQAQPDVVWVGLGKPLEQKFCVRHQATLKAGWLVTCGGLFRVIAGPYRRAPRWMQRAGLEWFLRLLVEPRYVGWRYLTTNPHALWLMWKHRQQAAARG